jgi:hypothetical protein
MEIHHTWAKREEKNKELTKHILAHSKTRRSPIQKSTTGPTHNRGRHQAQQGAHRPEQGKGAAPRARPCPRRACASTTARRPHLRPIGSIRADEGGVGVYSENIPPNRPNYLLYKEGLTPTLTHHSIRKRERGGRASFIPT